MKLDWIDDIPIFPMHDMLMAYLVESEKYGNLPNQPCTLPEYYESLRQRILNTNAEIADAKNRDDVAAAETRAKLFKGEMDTLTTNLRKGVVEGLLRTVYACVGHVDGRRTVVPAHAWSGEIDWDKES